MREEMKPQIKSLILIIGILIISINSLAQILTIPDIVTKYGKSVVLIASYNEKEETISLGSGFIVSPSGVIVTNYHVIKDSFPVLVKMINGSIYKDLYVIDINEELDYTVLKIEGSGLPTVKLGNSDNIKIGEQVVVIGNPKGLENSVSDGLISGIRNFTGKFNMYQISAPISPGSSGSPVFNRKGEVIGIATASIWEGQNLNFAIPINYIKESISKNPSMTLKEYIYQLNKVYFPPLTKDIIIPEKIRKILFSGMPKRLIKTDIPFEIIKFLYLPAKENIHNIFLFKMKLGDYIGSNVFIQFLKLENRDVKALAKEVYIPTYLVSPSYNYDDFYSVCYPLPPGNYLLAMAITSDDFSKIGTQYFEFTLPNKFQFDTTPIFFIKKMERMNSPETTASVHKNYFTYSVLKIWPRLENIFYPNENLDLFFYIFGCGSDRNRSFNITINYEVYKDGESHIKYPSANYNFPIISQPLPLIRTLSFGRKERLTSGSYTLRINILDNISLHSLTKDIEFKVR